MYDPSKVSVVSDFADYDGSQHPCQGMQVCRSRIKYMIKNNVDEKRIAYMTPRYIRHMTRIVHSTWGITYEVIGQQASGDITTSDDNTSKTKAVAINVVKEIINEGIIEYTCNANDVRSMIMDDNIDINLTSDDMLLVLKPNKTWDNESVERIFIKCSEQLGWKIKEDSFEVEKMTQEGRNEYLSHSVRRRSIYSQYKDKEYRCALLVRPRIRAYGKWKIAAEISCNPNKKDKAKLVSKYMTTIMTSIGMPELIVPSMHMIYKLRSSCSKYEQSYAWQGVTATTLYNIDLNSMYELQTNYKLNNRVDWIEIDEYEENLLKIAIKDFKKDVDKDIECNYITNDKNINWDVIQDNLFNYRAMMVTLSVLYRQLSIASRITTPEESHAWWTIADDEKEEDFKPLEDTLIIKCDHLNDIPEGEARGKYKINFKCSACYNKDIEKSYGGINIMYNKMTSKGGNRNDGIINNELIKTGTLSK
jgi:hypothetical protein